jgi:hypothetical protein
MSVLSVPYISFNSVTLMGAPRAEVERHLSLVGYTVCICKGPLEPHEALEFVDRSLDTSGAGVPRQICYVYQFAEFT